MKGPRSEWLQGYLDGELSSQQKEDFENNLNPGDRQYLEAESAFNSDLNQHLATPNVQCPEELWRSCQQKMLAGKTQNTEEVSSFQSLWPTLLKMAAVCLVAIAINLLWSPNNPKNSLKYANITPAIEGNLSQIQEILNQEGYKLNFKSIPNAHHKIKFVGMDWLPSKDKPQKAARLLFYCCDMPVILLLKQAQTAPSTPLNSEREYRNLLYHSKKGSEKYLIDAYSDHPPAEVLDLIY